MHGSVSIERQRFPATVNLLDFGLARVDLQPELLERYFCWFVCQIFQQEFRLFTRVDHFIVPDLLSVSNIFDCDGAREVCNRIC